MRRVMCLPLLLAGSLLLAAPEKETNKSVTGWVLDSACAFTKGLKKPISRECAIECAKKASPLVILAWISTGNHSPKWLRPYADLAAS